MIKIKTIIKDGLLTPESPLPNNTHNIAEEDYYYCYENEEEYRAHLSAVNTNPNEEQKDKIDISSIDISTLTDDQLNLLAERLKNKLG